MGKMDVDKLERQKTRAASKKKKEERKLAFGQKGDPRGGRMRTHTGASISSFSEMGGDQLKFGQSGLRHGRGQSISKKRGSMHSSKRGNGQLDNLIDNVKTGRTLEKDIYQRAQDANAAIEDKRAAILAKVNQANKIAGITASAPPRPTRAGRGMSLSGGKKLTNASGGSNPPPRPTRPSRRNKKTAAQATEAKPQGADEVKVDAFLNRLQGM